MKILKQQSKLPFSQIHKSNENSDSYLFKHNEVLLDKPIYVGFVILELSKLHMYEKHYDELNPYFGQKNLQIHYMDTDCFLSSVNTHINIKDFRNLKNLFDFSNLNKSFELLSNKNKKSIDRFKLETRKRNWIHEFIGLTSKMYALKNGDDSKNKLKCISKSYSKNFKFEEYKKV